MYSFNHRSESNDNAANTWYAPQEQGVSVHTGFPNPGIDSTAPELDLNRLLINHSVGTYLMRIAGDDWQHLGIFAGDIAIIDRTLPAKQNDIIVWWCDGDFAISQRTRMRPEAKMWGVVTATIHQFVTTKEVRS